MTSTIFSGWAGQPPRRTVNGRVGKSAAHVEAAPGPGAEFRILLLGDLRQEHLSPTRIIQAGEQRDKPEHFVMVGLWKRCIPVHPVEPGPQSVDARDRAQVMRELEQLHAEDVQCPYRLPESMTI